MAPRGRSRKVGTARIDAALDAMKPLGYPSTQVRAMMNKLLRVYGGVEGYYLIEQNAYKVLIDALTEEEEKKYWEAHSVEVEASTKQGNALDNQGVGDDSHVTAGPAAEAEGDTNGGEDTSSSQAVEGTAGREDHLHGLSLLASCATSSIEDEDDDDDDDVADDWASLPPAAQLRRSKRKAPLTNTQLRRSTRKLGSDRRPDDV